MASSLYSKSQGEQLVNGHQTNDSTQKPNKNGDSTAVNGNMSRVVVMEGTLPGLRLKVEKSFRSSSQSRIEIEKFSIASFLDFIASERLVHMPNQGSRWDKILRWAENFASQISVFQESTSYFLTKSTDAAQLAWSSCQLLLELGPNQALGLERAFSIFYKLGLNLSFFLRNSALFQSTAEVRQELGMAYVDVITLVVNVASYYREKIKGTSSTNINIEFSRIFGSTIDSFYHHRDAVANAMWVYQLQQSIGSQSLAVDIGTIRQWLFPQDRTVRALAAEHSQITNIRDEFTCEWFQKHLEEFTRGPDDVIAITGGPGCGKSMLSGWIAERLQQPVGGKSFETIAYTIDADISSEATPLGLVRGLLLQVLEQYVGNVDLYKSLASVYEMSQRSTDLAEVESALWRALDTALAPSHNLVLLIDGLDEIEGGESVALDLLHRIQKIVAKSNTARSIVLSQPFTKNLPPSTLHFAIQPNHTQGDVRQLVMKTLESFHHFHDQRSEEQTAVVDQITKRANGSFLWAQLVMATIEREDSLDSFVKTIEKIPFTIEGAVQSLIPRLHLHERETQLVLSWLLSSVRPMTVSELEDLLEISISTTDKPSNYFDVAENLRHNCAPLISVHNGVARFRHISIRQYMQQPDIAKIAQIPLHQAQVDLLVRILTFIKIRLNRHNSPSFDALEPRTLTDCFQKYSVLEYAVRYWPVHFLHSPMNKPDGTNEYTSDFKSNFPNSVLLVLLERSCWEFQHSTKRALEMHTMTLTIRRNLFGERDESVLQCLVVVALLFEKVGNRDLASQHFHLAARISRTILGGSNTLTIKCADGYLRCTSVSTTEQRNEVVNFREEMLKLLIAYHRQRDGSANEHAIKYNKMLAQMYDRIKETQPASDIYRDVYQASVECYGEFSPETLGVSKDLTAVLQKQPNRGEDIVQYSKPVFEIAERTMEVTDIRRIDATLHMAEVYESKKDFLRAEEIYVTIWHKVIKACDSKPTVENQLRKIEVTIHYVEFLRRYRRDAEATSILLGLWSEYEHKDLESDQVTLKLKTVGEKLRDLGCTAAALSIFSSVWVYFKRNKKQSSPDAVSIAVLLADTAQNEAQSGHGDSVHEGVLREVMDAGKERSKDSKVDVTAIRTALMLSKHYTCHERWVDVRQVCEDILHRLWPDLFATKDSPKLPGEFSMEAIELATYLADSFYRERRSSEAERFYLFIFHASKSTLRVQDDHVAETCKHLIDFYTNTNQSEKQIDVYKSLLDDYRNYLGKTHPKTVQLLYALGKLAQEYRRKDSDTWYLEILSSLNKDKDICHFDALKAANILGTLYYDAKRWQDARNIYHLLWVTFVKRGKEYNMSADTADQIYQKYTVILSELRVEDTVLRTLVIDFRNACLQIYGAQAALTLKVTLLLAQINARDSSKQQDAITSYEETIKSTEGNTKDPVMLDILSDAKRRLAHLLIANASSSPENAKKAVKLHSEQFSHTREQHGCSHPNTLNSLEELILLYKQRNESHLHTESKRELQQAVVDVVTKEKDPKRLYDSGSRLGSIYVKGGYTELGWDLLKEMRRQLVIKDYRSSNKFGFKLDKGTDRQSYLFLISFEGALSGKKSISYSEAMADYLTETLLYARYQRCIQFDTGLDVLLVHGARLRLFLVNKGRQDQALVFEDELFEKFMAKLGSSINQPQQVLRVFFVVLLEELGKADQEAHLGNAACVAGNDRIEKLLDQSKFQEAFDLATCVFAFVSHQHGYTYSQNIGNGFKLSLLMAGRGTMECSEQKLRGRMLELSKNVLREVISSCKNLKIDFVQMQFEELNDLVGLMGQQENYEDLEWLLSELWNSRHLQRSWPPTAVIHVGRRLVEVKFSHGHNDAAIRLCEDICYNLKHVWGPLDKSTLEMLTLLSQLYSTAGRHRAAMAVQVDVLHQELIHSESAKASPQEARVHLELLKRCYQRQGGWDKDVQVYKDLFSDLVEAFGQHKEWQGLQGIEKWKTGGADSLGTFVRPKVWEFNAEAEDGRQHENYLRRIVEVWSVENGHGRGGYGQGQRGGEQVAAMA